MRYRQIINETNMHTFCLWFLNMGIEARKHSSEEHCYVLESQEKTSGKFKRAVNMRRRIKGVFPMQQGMMLPGSNNGHLVQCPSL